MNELMTMILELIGLKNVVFGSNQILTMLRIAQARLDVVGMQLDKQCATFDNMSAVNKSLIRGITIFEIELVAVVHPVGGMFSIACVAKHIDQQSPILTVYEKQPNSRHTTDAKRTHTARVYARHNVNCSIEHCVDVVRTAVSFLNIFNPRIMALDLGCLMTDVGVTCCNLDEIANIANGRYVTISRRIKAALHISFSKMESRNMPNRQGGDLYLDVSRLPVFNDDIKLNFRLLLDSRRQLLHEVGNLKNITISQRCALKRASMITSNGGKTRWTKKGRFLHMLLAEFGDGPVDNDTAWAIARLL